MDTSDSPKPLFSDGHTVVITHRVHEDQHARYESWLDAIAPLSRAAPGHLDWHIIRPIAGITETYTIVIRFDTQAHLQEWMASPVRHRFIEMVQPLLVNGDDFYVSSGLDFWFTPRGARAKVPVRWKQALVTWSAIYPLALVVPLFVLPALGQLGASSNHYFNTGIVSGSVVLLMVYVVMPRYTKLLQRWLFS